MEEEQHITPDSVINPDKYNAYAILLNGKNVFFVQSRNNALFHLKDLAEKKYLQEARKQFPGREVFLDPNENETRFRIYRKREGWLSRDAVLLCSTIEMECIPQLRRLGNVKSQDD